MCVHQGSLYYFLYLKIQSKNMIGLHCHFAYILRNSKSILKRHRPMPSTQELWHVEALRGNTDIFWAAALRSWDRIELKDMACLQIVGWYQWGTLCSFCASGLPVPTLCQQLCLSQAGSQFFIQWVNFKWNENPSHNVWFTTQATGTVCLIND